jgi:hypothetical protein
MPRNQNYRCGKSRRSERGLPGMQGRGGRRPRRAAATPPPRRLIEFLAQMPTDTKIFLTMAVLGLATVLGLAYSPPRPGPRAGTLALWGVLVWLIWHVI